MPVDSEVKHYYGSIRDPVDERDYLFRPSLERVAAVPSSVDLTTVAKTEVFAQAMNDCTANAAIGLFMWLQQAVAPPAFTGSRMAEYKWGLDIDGATGDFGMFPRTAMQVMYQIGVAHDALWPYYLGTYPDDGSPMPNPNWNTVPPSNVTADASNNKATNYFRCDDSTNIENTINYMRVAIGGSRVVSGVTIPGVPVMFSTGVGDSFSVDGGLTGEIPVPTQSELNAGHSIIAIGYDDAHGCSDGSSGAFIIKNSWSASYGSGGYAWMPYNYLRVVDSLWSGYCDAWAIGLESQISTKPSIQIPSWAKKFPSMSEIDITNYLTLKHDGQPTPGQHSVEIVPVDGTSHVNAHVRVREKQPRRE